MTETATKMLKVYDSSATVTHPKRIHDMMFNGKVEQVVFEYGKPTELPMEKALKFRREGFTVVDADGTPYEPAKPLDSVIASRLKPGEVVANLTELKREALFLRASVIPGGEKTKSFKNEELIAFILENAENPLAQGGAAPTDGQSGGSAAAEGQLSDDVARKMLEAEGAGEDAL